MTWVRCLNPFEFRAGLKLLREANAIADQRLNPFEFRAGLKLPRDFICDNYDVLIPLNSGLA